MSNVDQASPPLGAQRILDDLRAELVTEETEGHDTEAGAIVVDRNLANALSGNMRSDVDEAADTVLESVEQHPSQDLQTRLSRNVGAVLKQRRRPLPTLLESARVAADMRLAEVADRLGIPPEQLQALERGRVKLWKAPDAVALVMAWISELKIPWSDADRAVVRMRPRSALPTYAKRDRAEDVAAAEQFVVALREEIGRRRSA